MRYGLIAFLLGTALYALFSSPTPDTPGMWEFLILGLLGLAAIPVKFQAEKFVWPLWALLAYGFFVPSIIGLLSAGAGIDMLRDMVAFAALCVPLFYAHYFPDDNARAQNYLLAVLLGTGLAFSTRYLFHAFSSLEFVLGNHGFLYLANSPLVMFAGAWLLLHGCFGNYSKKHSVLCVVAALIPLAAMVVMMQRATLALLAFIFVAFLCVALVKTPRRGFAVLLFVIVLAFVLWPLPAMVMQALHDKTASVGWNARGQEMDALLRTLADNPLTAIFGAGWGSLVKSPAVGDLWVRFSHSFFSALLWKCGWISLVLGVGAMAALVAHAVQRLKGDVLTLSALLLPLVPALFLYGSYKSLCFGLLLLGLAQLKPNCYLSRA